MKSEIARLQTNQQSNAETGQQRPRKSQRGNERKPGAWVHVEADLCKECGLCVEACPVGVLKISKTLNKMGYHPVEYTGEGCTGCGVCFYVCPEPGTFTVHKPGRVKSKH